MSTSTDDTVAQDATVIDEDRYRPYASTARVHAQIESAFREIVSEAASTASQFVHLAWADQKKGTAIVYGHLVDAAECLEIAAEHLDRLRALVAYRLQLEDTKNGSDLPF